MSVVNPNTVAQDQLQALIEDLRSPKGRREYLEPRLERLLGVDERTTRRALKLAGQILSLKSARLSTLWLGRVRMGKYSDADAMCGPLEPKRVGYVYWGRCVGNGSVVKIGFTTRPDMRANEVSRHFGIPVEIVSVRAGTMLDEFEEHQNHCAARIGWEFFSMPQWVAA